jgi:hypothetical protein
MKILSWDVGIYNLSYCILEKIDDTISIIDWDIVNLVDNDEMKKNRNLIFENIPRKLHEKPQLLNVDIVVIENQPSLKNPQMKSIQMILYSYFLILGKVIGNQQNNSGYIEKIDFCSASNKLKIATEGDIKQLIKAKKTDDTKAYKLTKSLGIKYCLELIQHLPIYVKHFNSHKKKDDLADSFLQGAYFYSNNINTPKVIKKLNFLV